MLKKLHIILTFLILIVGTITLQVGCDKHEETAGNTLSAPESNRWLKLLKVLPENENTIKSAYLSDLDNEAEITSDSSYNIGYNIPLFGTSPSKYSDEEWKATLGFTKDHVDQTIYSGALPVDYYQAVRGRFSREDVDNAARTGPGNEDVKIISYAGQELYSWGEDRDINISRRSNVRPLGQGYRLVLVDDFAFWVIWTDGIKEMIDACEGSRPSLADNKDYQLLAVKLQELDTVNAFFSAESHSLSHYYEVSGLFPREKQENEPDTLMQKRLYEALEYEFLLKPYSALATGAGKDEKGYYMVIVLVNEDKATARENAGLLEQRINNLKLVYPEDLSWKDIIDNMEIGNDGRLTIAKLYGKVITYWDQFEILGVMPYQPLLVSE
jgi:hypothetical protein